MRDLQLWAEQNLGVAPERTVDSGQTPADPRRHLTVVADGLLERLLEHTRGRGEITVLPLQLGLTDMICDGSGQTSGQCAIARHGGRSGWRET